MQNRLEEENLHQLSGLSVLAQGNDVAMEARAIPEYETEGLPEAVRG